jgi:hypothetical protein
MKVHGFVVGVPSVGFGFGFGFGFGSNTFVSLLLSGTTVR